MIATWLSLVLRAAALLALIGPAVAYGQAVPDVSRQLSQAEADLMAVDRALDARVDAEDRRLLRSRALAAKAAVEGATSRLGAQLALIDARSA